MNNEKNPNSNGNIYYWISIILIYTKALTQ